MGYLSFLREDAHHDLKVENQEEIMLLDTLNKEQKEELLNSRTRQEGTLLDDYLKAYTGNPQIVPNYQVKNKGNYAQNRVADRR